MSDCPTPLDEQWEAFLTKRFTSEQQRAMDPAHHAEIRASFFAGAQALSILMMESLTAQLNQPDPAGKTTGTPCPTLEPSAPSVSEEQAHG